MRHTARSRWVPHSSHHLGADAALPRVGLLSTVEPELRWAPTGCAAALPDLAGHPLELAHLALADMNPQRHTVIADPGGAVWLIACTRALLVTPVIADTDTVVLPRLLGGSWTENPPTALTTAGQVAAACRELADGIADAIDLREACRGLREAGANEARALPDLAPSSVS